MYFSAAVVSLSLSTFILMVLGYSTEIEDEGAAGIASSKKCFFIFGNKNSPELESCN